LCIDTTWYNCLHYEPTYLLPAAALPLSCPVLSSSLRYTDPIKGIEVHLSADQLDDKLNFSFRITDFTTGGLPLMAVKFLQEGLGPAKCSRQDEYDPAVEKGRPLSRGRSSRTGLPHVVELYHHLTQTGTDDFDLNVSTSQAGTTFRLRFSMGLMAPISAAPSTEAVGKAILGALLIRRCDVM
jgi:hypothetical protein